MTYLRKWNRDDHGLGQGWPLVTFMSRLLWEWSLTLNLLAQKMRMYCVCFFVNFW